MQDLSAVGYLPVEARPRTEFIRGPPGEQISQHEQLIVKGSNLQQGWLPQFTRVAVVPTPRQAVGLFG